jgi:hypothetical protein
MKLIRDGPVLIFNGAMDRRAQLCWSPNPGTYALTITEGCSGIGIDSVEVIFNGVAEAVDIGPT